MPKKARLVLEFNNEGALKLFLKTHQAMFVGDCNIRKMDQLDFRKMWSSNDYFIVRRHSQIPASQREFKEPFGG